MSNSARHPSDSTDSTPFIPGAGQTFASSALPSHVLDLDPAQVKHLSLPHFLGIGVQKAGTSWLWKMLTFHPRLHLPGPKEQHYFDREIETVPLEAYAARFKTDDARVAGEITPAYAVLPEARVALIRRVMPEVRLFILLRNPVDRAWSQALMNLVTQPDRRYEDVAPAEFFAHFDSAHATARGSYLRAIDLWEKHFSKEQFLVDFYEQISVAPRALLGRVMRHVGVEPPGDWSGYPVEKVFFKGMDVVMPDVYRDHLRHKFRDDIERLYDRYGEPVDAWRVK